MRRSPLAVAAGAPAAVWLLGVSFAMSSALLVADRSLAAQRRSLALLPLPACAGAALAAAVSGSRAAGAVAAIALVYASVEVRRS